MRTLLARPVYFARSLAGRIALILTLGISCAAIAALFVADHARRADFHRIRSERVIQSAVDVMRRVAQDPAGTEANMRSRLLVGAHLVGQDVAVLAVPNAALSAEASARAGRSVQLFNLPEYTCTRGDPFWKRPRAAGFSVPVQPECWLLRIERPGGPLHISIDLVKLLEPPSSTTQPVFLVMVIVASAALSFLVVSLAMAPARRLTEASRAFARSIDAEPVDERGPVDVREALHAFNLMQERVREGLRERTRLLAGISHDLQTPLTRLRLRLEQVEQPELRERLVADLSATLTMVKRGLDLARSSESAEEWSTVDLDSVLSSIAEDAAEFGQPVRFVGGCGSRVRVKPDALSRCLANLIDNAVKYGGTAELRCRRHRHQAIISVRDYGPGMPAELLQRAFEPFVRGEAESRVVSGTGIGLAIAKAQADAIGATLTVGNHAEGGVEAELGLSLA